MINQKLDYCPYKGQQKQLKRLAKELFNVENLTNEETEELFQKKGLIPIVINGIGNLETIYLIPEEQLRTLICLKVEEL